MSDCEAIVLAAGQGTRMKTERPKVLQPLAGWPMVSWSIAACRGAVGHDPYVVVPPESEPLREAVNGEARFVEQTEPLGTGHAALQAASAIDGGSDLVLVTSADMPLILEESLRRLVDTQEKNPGPLTLLSGTSDEARGFGRLLRDAEGRVTAIVEERLASAEQRASSDLNVGAYCFDAAWLWTALAELPRSEAGEYFLTDLIELADGPVEAIPIADPDEIIGVNTMEHLAEADAAARRRINSALMSSGVRLIDPNTTYIDMGVEIGPDTIIMPNTHILGDSRISSNCEIGPNSVLRSTQAGDGCHILSSDVDRAQLGSGVHVGPYARLRPGALLSDEVHVGNFGEIKNSTLAPRAKVGHFSYLGDATIGEDVNIGAGTITCNYDGKRKHKTIVGEGAFIGSDTMLVAPVEIGAGARTGAGAVVTKDIPARTLAVGVPARVIRKLNDDD